MKNIHILLGITIGFIFSLILQIALFSPLEKPVKTPPQKDYISTILKTEKDLLEKEKHIDSLSHDLEKAQAQNQLELAKISAHQQKLFSMAIQLKTDTSFSENQKIEKLIGINESQYFLHRQKDSLYQFSLSNYKGLYLLEKSLQNQTMKGFLDCKKSIVEIQSDNARLYSINQKLETKLLKKKNTSRLLSYGVVSLGVLSTVLILSR